LSRRRTIVSAPDCRGADCQHHLRLEHRGVLCFFRVRFVSCSCAYLGAF
jgi:hypothetical protein